MTAAEAGRGGLEGVVAGASALCDINGQTGTLGYCGYDIRDLAVHAGFAETCALLWHGELPTAEVLAETERQLVAALDPPPAVWDIARSAPAEANTMALLRTQVSALGLHDPQAEEMSEVANRAKAIRLVGQTAAIVVTSERIRSGLEPVSPRNDLSFAGNVLWMLHGQEADELMTRVFDICLVLHAEHGMNASTFAARVTAATLSDMHSAVTSAIGALKGPLHGGANEAVMELLVTLPDAEHVPDRIREMLAKKQRVMGFGHRVYRTEDPRATILREYSRALGERAGDTRWYDLTLAVERTVHAEKHLYPNVDLYSASVYTYLGIPSRLFTPIFALSRMAGWTANILEQLGDNRLIRPDSDYIGSPPREWTPVAERGATAVTAS